jgi:hypothetical protein
VTACSQADEGLKLTTGFTEGSEDLECHKFSSKKQNVCTHKLGTDKSEDCLVQKYCRMSNKINCAIGTLPIDFEKYCKWNPQFYKLPSTNKGECTQKSGYNEMEEVVNLCTAAKIETSCSNYDTEFFTQVCQWVGSSGEVVNCNEATSLFSEISVPADVASYVTKVSNESLKIVLLSETGTKQLDLNKIIKWKSNGPLDYECGAKAVKLCSDATCSSTDTSMMQPAVEDAAGRVTAMLSIN